MVQGLDMVRRQILEDVIPHPDLIARAQQARIGDALVIHPFTYHASLPRNPGAGRRVAYSSRWLGDDVIWWKREMTFTYPDDRRFDKVEQGKAPPQSTFPIMWQRKEYA